MLAETSPWDSRVDNSTWIATLATELMCTSEAMSVPLLEFGNEGASFVWEPQRRHLLRNELDAAFFHLYGVERGDVAYIMDTFPIVRRKDEQEYGEYRTKRLILEVYDAMSKAIATGEPYQTILDPPPGEGPRHPERTRHNGH